MIAAIKSMLCSRTTWIAVAVALVLSFAQIYGWLTSEGRIAPEVHQALQRSPSINVVVTLPFAPERFHLDLFQAYGSVGVVRGNTVLLRRVRKEGIEALSRMYWISKVTPEARQVGSVR